MSIFFLSLMTNLAILVSLLIRFSTRNKIFIKDEIVMFLISSIFSILFSAADIDNEKNLNWWCSPINEPMIPFILSLAYLLFTTFFFISLKLRIKSAKSSTQNESDDTLNESHENNLFGAGNESNSLHFVEIEKITSYIFAVWLILFIYTITQVAMVDSVVIGVYYMFGRSNSNTNLVLTPITTNSTSRESRRSFRESVRNSFQKIFTKIQVQVVQHQTVDSYSDCGDDGHVRLEIPTVCVSSSVS
ncbi:7491_t:CDS:2 [Dentiscutata erythropus]|uniref:7491_t:CDS:1 n=1 Tax=Dentiscutata erythropus TaxID=1348616 RepID=A0A9N9HP84_9GLOM|nr:7491_t:CDS:2 [Dentiscutata erythropus]